MEGHKNIWEASVTMKYRITFEIEQDAFLLRRIGEHDKVLRNP
jgi:mRNA-degrading endonuclease YafQ of YafQ-DinJ toxin-antitoxin module